eukprot:TRINITY_DN72251_c0_g1_i1.p2 TRINITY_DN72251_c0_g1~~TRINITY_DN72251_c0_g1_i1.p2  ORF type:complete len:207 (-),score=58.37 TRINITY_DN72251_c0_g1_i1:52-672(-)
MGKYHKGTKIAKTKSTSATPKGLLKKQQRSRTAKGKAKKRALKEKAVATSKKSGKKGVVDTSNDMVMEASGGAGSSTRAESEKLVALLQKTKMERKVEEALKKALRAGPGQEALGAALVHCAGRGLLGCVRALLEVAAPVNAQDPSQSPGRTTAIQLAASRGHVSVVRMLLDAGADRTGALEASQELSTLGAVFAEEKRAIQAMLA